MRYSGTDLDDDNEPWFRLGQLQVTSTVFVLLLWVATLLIFIVEPADKPVMTAMALFPSDVAGGELWRVVTWPWSHNGFGLFDLIGAALFFLFGTDLERQTGRRRFALLLGSSILIIAGAATLWGSILSEDTVIADLDLLGLTVLLLYVAEHPTRPFFFGIPAWVIGAVIVALEVVNDLAYRDWTRLLTIALAAVLIALVARRVDLLTQYDRVPHLKGRERGPKPKKVKKSKKADGPGPARSSARPGPAPEGKKRSGPLWGKGREDEPAEIVQMPVQRRRVPAPSDMPDVSADDLALDALLDKITEGGMDSLTEAERQELSDLRARRRSPGSGGSPSS